MHPLPEDVSRKNTYDIVEKIRCEAAEGLRGVRRDHPILKNTFIGYDFEFDITETNQLGTSGKPNKLELERKYLPAGGSLKIDSTAFADRTRQTQRNFRIVESLLQLSNADCGPTATRENWAYPITGAIGMQEVVSTYIGLERLTDFGKPQNFQSIPVEAKTQPIIFSDVLTYTTNLGAGVNPTLTLTSVVGSFKVSKASLFGDVSRIDKHKVRVALARDPEDPNSIVDRRNSRAAAARSADQEYLDRTAGAAIYNPRLARAADAVAKKSLTADTLVTLELERLRDLEEEGVLANRLVNILKPPP
jgi:hypothetical protein